MIGLMRLLIFPGLLCVVLLATLQTASAYLTLATGDRSEFVIYRDPGVAPSVQTAAEEIQRIVRASTGAELPIVDQPASPMVCLGENDASRQAGVTAEGLADDGFRIVAAGGSIYIVGKDSPDDRGPWVGFASRGTMFGSYDFLERAVGVRWLLPGEWGEDIPAHETLSVPEMNLQDAPDFWIRSIVNIQDRKRADHPGEPPAARWLLRHKLLVTGEGRRTQHGHAWVLYTKPESWGEHPEYLALSSDGTRRMPARPPHVKYCTADPELVAYFAAGVNKWLDERSEW